MYCYSVAKHITTVSIDTVCITIHLSNRFIYTQKLQWHLQILFIPLIFCQITWHFLSGHIRFYSRYNVESFAISNDVLNTLSTPFQYLQILLIFMSVLCATLALLLFKRIATVSIDTVKNHSIIISERQKHINTSAIVSYAKKVYLFKVDFCNSLDSKHLQMLLLLSHFRYL